MKLPGQSIDFKDLSYGFNPRQFSDQVWDFLGTQPYFDIDVPLMENTNNPGANIISLTDTHISRALVEMPRAGRLISAQLTAEDALAAHDTNFVTFAVTNKLGSGSGSTAMLAATDANTTKATGGVAITAVIGRPLTIHGTAANLRVAAGDVIEVKATTAGTLANAVDVPRVKLRFATIDNDLTPVIARTAGSPLVGPVDDTANGEIIGQLSATNEVNTAGWTLGDQLCVVGSKVWMFEALVKVGTIATNERAVIGVCSAYNATWDSTTINAWFRLEGSMAALAETDDDTSNRDDQSTGVTLTANTYYLFRIYKNEQGSAHFYIQNLSTNENWVVELGMAALSTAHLIQPIIAVQKASGTGTPSITCDWMRLVGARQ